MADPIDDKSNQNGGEGQNQNNESQNKENQGESKVDLSNADAVNQKIGELGKTVKDFEDYKKKVEPILNAIYRDPKVYQAVNESYQVLMGVKQPERSTDASSENKGEDKKADPAVSVENDNRNALIKQSVESWEAKHGIDKLDGEKKGELNNKVLSEIKFILDPAGTGKSGADLLSGVPVSSVSGILDRAYFLATRDEQIASAKEDAIKERQNSELGMIGSIPSGSVSEDSVKLTEREMAIARKQGITPEKYLANKKEILKRKGSIV